MVVLVLLVLLVLELVFLILEVPGRAEPRRLLQLFGFGGYVDLATLQASGPVPWQFARCKHWKSTGLKGEVCDHNKKKKKKHNTLCNLND